MANESKTIRKTDDSAIALLYDTLNDKTTTIGDIDSYYKINGKYIFLEFIKCEVRPFEYEPMSYWANIRQHILVVWDFTIKAKGSLWLVCYEEQKEQFRLLRVEAASESGIEYSKKLDYNFDQFRFWFQRVNSEVLKR